MRGVGNRGENDDVVADRRDDVVDGREDVDGRKDVAANASDVDATVELSTIVDDDEEATDSTEID